MDVRFCEGRNHRREARVRAAGSARVRRARSSVARVRRIFFSLTKTYMDVGKRKIKPAKWETICSIGLDRTRLPGQKRPNTYSDPLILPIRVHHCHLQRVVPVGPFRRESIFGVSLSPASSNKGFNSKFSLKLRA